MLPANEEAILHVPLLAVAITIAIAVAVAVKCRLIALQKPFAFN